MKVQISKLNFCFIIYYHLNNKKKKNWKQKFHGPGVLFFNIINNIIRNLGLYIIIIKLVNQ